VANTGQAEAIKLLGYNLETAEVKPGGQVAVTLYWEALASTARPYSVFVHLLNKDDILVTQRDTYPGLGLRATTQLKPGETWADRYVISIPETAYAPDVIQVAVGLYDYVDQNRMMADNGSDHVRFGQIAIRAQAGELANPISINFDNKMALVGYEIDKRVLKPGETITLTMYWRGLQKMVHNYTISAQVVNDAQVKIAENNNWPLGNDAPTMLWEPGNLLADPKPLTVRTDAPPGTCEVRVTVYKKQDEGFIYLPVISDRGEMLANYVVLTKIRVESHMISERP
jgi:hypothetical protein